MGSKSKIENVMLKKTLCYLHFIFSFQGFGFTLKGSNDFKLEEFHVAPSECFEPHYGKFPIQNNASYE